jgi:peroxiredoxin
MNLRIIKMIIYFSFVLSVGVLCCCKSSRPNNTSQERDLRDFKEGSAAVPFSLVDAQGRAVNLTDFSSKVVLLNFWATWCVPCVQEMPSLQRLYDKHKSRGLEVVSINVNAADERKNALDFMKRLGLTFPVLFDPDGQIAQGYGLTGYPESFFIAPGGTFIAFADPLTGKTQVRIIADRVWDSQPMLNAVSAILDNYVKRPAGK